MLLTLTAGFLFGPWLGAIYALVGATLGATVVFLAARSGLYGLAARAGPRGRRLEAGFRADAFNYLLVLRLIPVFPFWLVNLVAGLAGMRLRDLRRRDLLRNDPWNLRLCQPRQRPWLADSSIPIPT